MKRFLKLIGCDKRWMIVEFLGHHQVWEVQHYFGRPSLGWEYFDMEGPFADEASAKAVCNKK
jgi:hypothetical protein